MGIEGVIIEAIKALWHLAFPPKPDLKFTQKDFVHWYDEENFQSGIILEMFINNRGNNEHAVTESSIPRSLVIAMTAHRNEELIVNDE